jgi:hypothetical protein
LEVHCADDGGHARIWKMGNGKLDSGGEEPGIAVDPAVVYRIPRTRHRSKRMR